METAAQQALQVSPANGQKRKKSVEEAGSERVIKHRSSKACKSCRDRKVRCDITVTTLGSRCTNCRLDSLECVLLPSRRGKNNHTRRTKSQGESGSLPQRPKDVTDSQADGARKDNSARRATVPALHASNEPVPVVVTFDEESDNVGSDQQQATEESIRRNSEHASISAYDELLTPDSAPNLRRASQTQHPAVTVPLPAFITPLSSRISNEDLEFLIRKGALTVPDPEAYMEILRSYLFSVHPFMPMLDYRNFINAVVNNYEDGRISLLLFQSVMFAGLHSLPLDTILRLGFESTKHAREVFFNRARLLYEFDIEPESSAILQSLILMSTWYGKWDERRHTWHYTGLAYDMARNMGLHREPSSRYSSDKIRHFRRRLWWSLYIRDRMIALGTRRPLRIRDDDFDVAMLTPEDFDLEPFVELHSGQPLLPSAKENKATALMCVQLAKLCGIIGKITSSQYTVLNPNTDAPNTMMVVPKRDGSGAQELESCNQELNEWFQSLSTNVRRNTTSKTIVDPHSCSEVHWAVLNLTYLTVVNVLHRAQALKPLLESGETQTNQDSSRSRVKEAARGLTRLSQTMLRHDQVRFLGTVGVTALVAACLSHMLDISSGDEDVRDASTFRLYQSLEVLTALTGAYASADAAVSFLTSVTRKAGISVPVQVTVPTSAASTDSSIAKPLQTGQLRVSTQNIGDSAPGSQSLSSAQTNGPPTNWSATSSQQYVASTDDHSDSSSMMDQRGHIVATNNGLMPPIARAGPISPTTPGVLQAQDLSGPGSTAVPGVHNFVHAGNEGFPIPVAGTDSFDWNNAASMDFEPMAFTYDFYSDAFGFLDGRFQGI